jgi:hypothetical protein
MSSLRLISFIADFVTLDSTQIDISNYISIHDISDNTDTISVIGIGIVNRLLREAFGNLRVLPHHS